MRNCNNQNKTWYNKAIYNKCCFYLPNKKNRKSRSLYTDIHFHSHKHTYLFTDLLIYTHIILSTTHTIIYTYLFTKSLEFEEHKEIIETTNAIVSDVMKTFVLIGEKWGRVQNYWLFLPFLSIIETVRGFFTSMFNSAWVKYCS